MNAIDKAYKALVQDGRKLTAKQMSSWFGVSNPGDLVYRLRNEGHRIVQKTFEDTKGRKTRKYFVSR